MKVLMYHVLVVVYYVLFDLRLAELVEAVAKDQTPLSENVIVHTLSLCTIWNLVLQQIYFLASVLSDVTRLTCTALKDARKTSAMEDFTNTVFTRFVFPFAVVIDVNFWLIYSLDRANFDQYQVMEKHFTLWDNHRMHSMIVVLAIIELLMTHKKYPRSTWNEMKQPLVLLLVYLIVVAVAQRCSTFWIYQFLAWVQWYHCVAFVAANIALTCLSYQAGKFLSESVWDDDDVEDDSHKESGQAQYSKLKEKILGEDESKRKPRSVGCDCNNKVWSITGTTSIDKEVRSRTK